MGQIDKIGLLGQFLENHTSLPESACINILRAAGEGTAFTLPEAGDFDGGKMRAQLAHAFPNFASTQALAVGRAPSEQETPTAKEGTMWRRRLAFRRMAGDRLTAFADALAGSSVTVGQAAILIARERASVEASHSAVKSVAERMANMPEFGGSFEHRSSGTDTKAGWAKALAKAGVACAENARV